MEKPTVLITGNTYPVKDALRSLGGRWDPDAHGWRVPADKAQAAQALVTSAPKSAPRSSAPRRDSRSGCAACCRTATRTAQIWEDCEICGTEPVYR